MKLSDLENTYKNLSSSQLLKVAKDADTLKVEAIPLLKKELMARGYEVEAHQLEFINRQANPYEGLSLKEIQRIVSDRLETGESLDSIHSDLKTNDVNVLNLFQKDVVKKEQAFKVIEEELNGAFPKEKLQHELNLNDDEIEELKDDMKGRGKGYTYLGFFFIACGIVSFILGLAIGLRWTAVVIMLVSGFGLLARGKSLSRRHNE